MNQEVSLVPVKHLCKLVPKECSYREFCSYIVLYKSKNFMIYDKLIPCPYFEDVVALRDKKTKEILEWHVECELPNHLNFIFDLV